MYYVFTIPLLVIISSHIHFIYLPTCSQQFRSQPVLSLFGHTASRALEEISVKHYANMKSHDHAPPTTNRANAIVLKAQEEFKSKLAIMQERQKQEIAQLNRRHLHNLAHQRKRLLARYDAVDTDSKFVEEDVRAAVVYDLKAQIATLRSAIAEKEKLHLVELKSLEANLGRRFSVEMEATTRRCDEIIARYRKVADEATEKTAKLELDMSLERERNKRYNEELTRHMKELCVDSSYFKHDAHVDKSTGLKTRKVLVDRPKRVAPNIPSPPTVLNGTYTKQYIANIAALEDEKTRSTSTKGASGNTELIRQTIQAAQVFHKGGRHEAKRSDDEYIEGKRNSPSIKASPSPSALSSPRTWPSLDNAAMSTTQAQQETFEISCPSEIDVIDEHMEYFMHAMWEKFDSYDTGFLNAVKFKMMLETFTHQSVTKSDCESILKSIDQNGDALISRDELADFIMNGIVMNAQERANYRKSSKLHSMLSDFFEGINAERIKLLEAEKRKLKSRSMPNTGTLDTVDRGKLPGVTAPVDKKLQLHKEKREDRNRSKTRAKDTEKQVEIEKRIKVPSNKIAYPATENGFAQKIQMEAQATERGRINDLHIQIGSMAASKAKAHLETLERKSERVHTELQKNIATLAAKKGIELQNVIHRKIVFEDERRKEMYTKVALHAAQQGKGFTSTAHLKHIQSVEEENQECLRIEHESRLRADKSMDQEARLKVDIAFLQETLGAQFYGCNMFKKGKGGMFGSAWKERFFLLKIEAFEPVIAYYENRKKHAEGASPKGKLHLDANTKVFLDAKATLKGGRGGMSCGLNVLCTEDSGSARTFELLTKSKSVATAWQAAILHIVSKLRDFVKGHDMVSDAETANSHGASVTANPPVSANVPEIESVSSSTIHHFKENERVRVAHEEWTGRYSGIITSIDTNACTVSFDDGDVKHNLPFSTIFAHEVWRVGDVCSVQMDLWDEAFVGTIEAVNDMVEEEEQTFQMHFAEDNTYEENVPGHSIIDRVKS